MVKITSEYRPVKGRFKSFFFDKKKKFKFNFLFQTLFKHMDDNESYKSLIDSFSVKEHKDGTLFTKEELDDTEEFLCQIRSGCTRLHKEEFYCSKTVHDGFELNAKVNDSVHYKRKFAFGENPNHFTESLCDNLKYMFNLLVVEDFITGLTKMILIDKLIALLFDFLLLFGNNKFCKDLLEVIDMWLQVKRTVEKNKQMLYMPSILNNDNFPDGVANMYESHSKNKADFLKEMEEEDIDHLKIDKQIKQNYKELEKSKNNKENEHNTDKENDHKIEYDNKQVEKNTLKAENKNEKNILNDFKNTVIFNEKFKYKKTDAKCFLIDYAKEVGTMENVINDPGSQCFITIKTENDEYIICQTSQYFSDPFLERFVEWDNMIEIHTTNKNKNKNNNNIEKHMELIDKGNKLAILEYIKGVYHLNEQDILSFFSINRYYYNGLKRNSIEYLLMDLLTDIQYMKDTDIVDDEIDRLKKELVNVAIKVPLCKFASKLTHPDLYGVLDT